MTRPHSPPLAPHHCSPLTCLDTLQQQTARLAVVHVITCLFKAVLGEYLSRTQWWPFCTRQIGSVALMDVWYIYIYHHVCKGRVSASGYNEKAPPYGTCHNKVTILRPCYGYKYRRSTGTHTGAAQVQVRACQEYSYRCRTITALRHDMQLRSMP